jgi:ubiquinone/menaquinone biosynthesis C-methylase UbiE
MSAASAKPYKMFAMEGALARWYAGTTGKDLAPFRDCARKIADRQPAGARLLEIAPGPGYLAIELARLGSYTVAGLDISRSFVAIATENAAKAGVTVDFRVGNAAAMPYAADEFDFTVCRAAFKNFTQPDRALREMHRILRPGGQALIIDMRRDASNEAIDQAVRGMGLSRTNALITRVILKYGLRRRAYTIADLRRMVDATMFRSCHIDASGLGFEAWLTK